MEKDFVDSKFKFDDIFLPLSTLKRCLKLITSSIKDDGVFIIAKSLEMFINQLILKSIGSNGIDYDSLAIAVHNDPNYLFASSRDALQLIEEQNSLVTAEHHSRSFEANDDNIDDDTTQRDNSISEYTIDDTINPTDVDSTNINILPDRGTII